MVIHYDRELNIQQHAAVSHEKGPALVIAGAGTGKTRTLTFRVARLVETGTDPRSILLLTFTRRAAQEMLRRAGGLVADRRIERISGGTFHAFAHAVLRTHAKQLGFSRHFTVLDRSDAEDILQHLRTDLGYAGLRGRKNETADRRRFPQKRTLLEMLSLRVNSRCDLAAVLERQWPQFSREEEHIETLFERYHLYKREHQLLDYDDLLVFLHAILQNSSVSDQLAHRFQYVLVDEYQDTNRLQSEILQMAASHQNIMAVGDDAQSIYSFRGADVKNILRFPQDFPGAKIYTIEQNYRSTQPILTAANTVMERSQKRYKKNLFTNRAHTNPPRLVGCADDAAQASFTVDEILNLREEGIALEHIAVLFRSSYHSFVLEAELARRNIPFVKYGGFKFAEAAHVKDALAHLRWCVNPKDLIAAQRCLLLLDGVGPVAARQIADRVALASSLPRGLESVDPPLRARAAYQRLMRACRVLARAQHPSDQLRAILPYLQVSIAERFDDYPKRLRDLEYLSAIARKFRSTERFVSDFSIDPPVSESVVRVDGVGNEEEPLVLSTIHSAKGLEWKAVFILSVLDGFLPQDYALRSEDELEEERRLLYVAMTRAKDILTLTYPTTIVPAGPTALFGEPVYAKLSQFLDGISNDVLSHTVLAAHGLFDSISYDETDSF